MMKNSVDKATRFEQAINLSKGVVAKEEQAQIQEMLKLLAEKFIKDLDVLQKLKEMINMGIINQMIANDKAVEIAKNMLRKGSSVEFVLETTGLDESTVVNLQAEMVVA
jgi:hypothetical protein